MRLFIFGIFLCSYVSQAAAMTDLELKGRYVIFHTVESQAVGHLPIGCRRASGKVIGTLVFSASYLCGAERVYFSAETIGDSPTRPELFSFAFSHLSMVSDVSTESTDLANRRFIYLPKQMRYRMNADHVILLLAPEGSHYSRGFIMSKRNRRITIMVTGSSKSDIDDLYNIVFSSTRFVPFGSRTFRTFVTGLNEVLSDNLPNARQAFVSATQADPENNMAWTSLAVVDHREKKWESAAASYKRALNANPADARARYRYSLLLAMLGKYNEAQTHLEVMKQDNDARSEACFLRGYIANARGKAGEARNILEQCMITEISPEAEALLQQLNESKE